MMIYTDDGGVLHCSEIEVSADTLIADGIWMVPVETVEKITEGDENHV